MENPNQELKQDKKDLYNSSYGSIFARNFTAGFAKALGALTLYLLLGSIIYYLTIAYILPQLQSFIPTSWQQFPPLPLYNQLLVPQTNQKTDITPQEAEQMLLLLEKGEDKTATQ